MNNNMYDVVKNVITSRNYDLTDILGKIETVWIQSRITDDQKMELIDLARRNAEVQQSIDLLAKVEEHEKRLAELEELVKNLTASKEDDEEVTEESYEEYVSGRWCKNGDIFTFDGKLVRCIAPEGVTCVWSPTDYPEYWEEYVEDAPLTE